MYEIEGLYTKATITYDGKTFKTLLNSADLSLFSKEEIGELLDGLKYLYYEADAGKLNRYNQDKKAQEKLEWKRFNEGYYDKPYPKKIKDKEGFVYVIKELFTGTYKIGYSKYMKSRAATFGVQLPFEWEFTHIFKSSDADLLESILHNKFKVRRVRGEWFDLDDLEVNYLSNEVLLDESMNHLIIGVEDIEKYAQ